MRRLALIALTISILTLSNSLAQCKWKIDKVDPISDTKHLESKKIKIKGWSTALDVKIIKKENKIYINTLLFAGTITDETLNNPKLEIKLDDGTLLTLVPFEASGKFYGTLYGITFNCDLDNQDIESLSKSPVIAFQLSFNAVEKLFEPKEKDGEKVMEYASCLK